ncbi:glycosyltransferase family 4 protein [Candidatus Woesebacteria bacterium]|nr:glycosyltransferase family 4 protein [Candidatus Woesebacteria bacterium]
MKIAIDASQIIYGTGVSFYTKNLIKNILRIDSSNEYLLFGGSLRRRSELIRGLSKLNVSKSADLKVFPFPPSLMDFVWNRVHLLPIENLIGDITVLHSSDWVQPPTKAFKVTTIHDLAPFKFPQYTNRKIIAVHKRRLEWVAKEVNRVIVPSLATKNDLLEIGFNEKIIRVIPEAPGEEFKKYPDDKIVEIKNKYNLRGKYLLTIGVGGRKNTDRLIKAYESAKIGKELKLALVGANRSKQGEDRGLRFLGQIDSDYDLALLINGAEAFIYPSLYEGFGLPILQAFACGCPVVTSDVSSMVEIAKGASVLVDPNSIESVSEGIKSVLRRKETLIQSGLEKAKNYSWENTAKETIKVYKEAR